MAFGPAITQRIRQQVLQDTPQKGRIGRDEGPRRHQDQLGASSGGNRREGGAQGLEQWLQGKRSRLRLERTGIELGDVEQRIQQRFDGAEAGVDLAAKVVPGIAIDHRGSEQARRMQRLQQVVTGGGDEPRLAEVGGLGLGPTGFKLGGTLDHTLLQRFRGLPQLTVAFAQRLGRVHARRHVVAGRDEAIARQRIQPELYDAAFAGGDFVCLRRFRPPQQSDDVGAGAELLRRSADRDGVVVE